MNPYRCYCLGRDNQIRAAEDVEAKGSAEAIERSLAMLSRPRSHQASDVWQGARVVFPSAARR